MPASPLLSDADLHGLVDGHIDPDRRADVLRRAAASPRDRALIEAWQDQNDMIRAAFAGVESEPVPSGLDLRTPPQLRAVPRVPKPIAPVKVPRRGRGRIVGAVVTFAAVTAGLAGSWYVAGLPAEAPSAPPTHSSSLERMLADRTASALAFGETDASPRAAVAEPPPTAIIPDLTGDGFTFTGAEARDVRPKTVIFRYRDADDERIAIGATRTDGADGPPVSREAGFTWRNGHVAYAIFGTLPSARLRAIAMGLEIGSQSEVTRK